jgi:hypothetical protein
MRLMLLSLLTLSLLLVAAQAMAMESPVVTTPQEGAALGPNYDIMGTMPYKAFLVLLTDVLIADGTVLRTVPGIRHWTAADGTFHFRAASPRVSIGEKDTVVGYRIRIFEATAQETGPETVINCPMAR